MPKSYHVTWDEEAGLWTLTEEGQAAPVGLFETQEAAAQAGRQLTRGEGRVTVHKRDGRFSKASS